MHIAFFNRSFYPDISATGQLLTELCEDLTERYGCSVTVVAGMPLVPSPNDGIDSSPNDGIDSSPNDGIDSSPNDGIDRRRGILFHCHRGILFYRQQYRKIRILRVKGTGFPKNIFLGRISNYLTFFLGAVVSSLHLDPPDVVVALTDPPIIGLAGYFVSRRFGARFVMSYRDLFPEAAAMGKSTLSGAVAGFLDGVNRFLLKKAVKIVVLGGTMRHKLIREKGADPKKIVLIPDWADCSSLVPGPKRNRFSLAHGILEKFIVMHSGNVGLSQGLEVLLPLAQYLQGFPEIQIVLVGDGVKRKPLEDRARSLGLKNILFLPYQPRQNLSEVFSSADLFLISLKAGLAGYIVPSKIYGILAAGRPYVAAVEEACEVASVTRQYRCGLLAEPGNPLDLAEKILTLYRDRPLAQRLGANARGAAFSFDRSVWVRAYYELFRTLTDGQKGPHPQRLCRKGPSLQRLHPVGSSG